jgi:hypothetical protein
MSARLGAQSPLALHGLYSELSRLTEVGVVVSLCAMAFLAALCVALLHWGRRGQAAWARAATLGAGGTMMVFALTRLLLGEHL